MINTMVIIYAENLHREVKKVKEVKINSVKIKNTRRELGLRQRDVAQKMGMPLYSYQSREDGRVCFSNTEKIELSNILGFSPQQMNEYLYGGLLPIGTCQ